MHKNDELKPRETSSKQADSAGDDSFSFDFSKVKNFFSDRKKMHFAVILLFLLVPIFLTFYIRLMPQDLPQTDNWARNSVENYFRTQISQNVNLQYPNLPQSNKDQLVNQQFSDFKKNNGIAIDQQVKSTSEYFKTGFRYTENNHTYTFLGDLDSYFYLRQARNLISNGTVCDVYLADGTCWDNYLLAPLGGEVSASMHPYGIVAVFKILRIFDSSINLMKASFILPTFLAAIASIAAFFIGRKLMNEVAGFFAAMFVAINPLLITRTLGSDTDIWNITLPLLIVWVFIEAFEADSLVNKIILAALSGLFLGLFAFAWGGWWYIFDFILLSVAVYFAITLAKNYFIGKKVGKLLSKQIINNAIAVGVLLISTLIFVSITTAPGVFFAVFLAPFSTFTTLKAAAHANLWPNVFTTVAELSEANLATIVGQTSFGINWLFTLSILGIIFTLIKRKPDFKEHVLIGVSISVFLYLISNSAFGISPFIYVAILLAPIVAALVLHLTNKESEIDIKPALLFTIWYMGLIIASIKGVRFIFLIAPIFAIGVGVTIGFLYQYLQRMASEDFNVNKIASAIIIFAVLCLILITPVKAGIAAGENFTPSMTSGWWDSLSKIRQESKPDAIINSWWDFGHWFKFVAERRVTLDGVTQNHPNAHWLGLILQTSNENEAVGILRMLDCGSNNAYWEVDKKFSDSEKSENIVSKLVLLSKDDGESYLKNLGFTQLEVATISNYTYCNPPEDYFITSGDMVGKAGVWAHFGLWDFDRAFMVNNVRPNGFEEGTKILRERFNFSDEQATSTYYELQSLQSDQELNSWISPWPNYFLGNWVSCIEQNKTKSNPDTNQTYVTGKRLLCPINTVVNQDANGRTVLEGAVYDVSDPRESTIVVGAYDSSGVRRSGANARPSAFVAYYNETVVRTPLENASFGFDAIIDMPGNRMLIAAPELSQSIFTKLFYLDGRGTSQFEKFSDVTDITGLRIIVWQVKWKNE